MTPTLAPTSLSASAARPQDAVEAFYRLVTARDYRGAYSQFTPAFQQQHPYAEFEGCSRTSRASGSRRFRRRRPAATARSW